MEKFKTLRTSAQFAEIEVDDVSIIVDEQEKDFALVYRTPYDEPSNLFNVAYIVPENVYPRPEGTFILIPLGQGFLTATEAETAAAVYIETPKMKASIEEMAKAMIDVPTLGLSEEESKAVLLELASRFGSKRLESAAKKVARGYKKVANPKTETEEAAVAA